MKYLRIYTMTKDDGFAPHVKDKLLSLACCTRFTREDSKVNDFVLGISGKTMKGVPKHVPIYFMKVNEKLTFDEYFHDERFEGRVDNIYRLEKGAYIQDRKHDKNSEYLHRHKGGGDAESYNKLLISEEFRYFGDHWKNDMSLHEVMENFCQDKGISYVRGHPKKANLNDDSVEKLLSFFENNFSNGKIGEPNHINEIKQIRERNTGSC